MFPRQVRSNCLLEPAKFVSCNAGSMVTLAKSESSSFVVAGETLSQVVTDKQLQEVKEDMAHAKVSYYYFIFYITYILYCTK